MKSLEQYLFAGAGETLAIEYLMAPIEDYRPALKTLHTGLPTRPQKPVKLLLLRLIFHTAKPCYFPI